MKKCVFIVLTLMFVGLIQLHADDTDLFMLQVPPDTLLLLDMSGSMNCWPSGPPYASAPNRRIDIARAVIKDLLDDTDDGNITVQDDKSLNMRFGYMRFFNAYGEDDGEPTTGVIKVLSPIGSSFNDIWSNVSVPSEDVTAGGTPLAASMAEAKTYFVRDVNPPDTAIACRKKFVILITDGADTYACGGNGVDPTGGDETRNPGMPNRRMLTVQRAKELNEQGVKVFVVGFGGGMPEQLKRTLNWTAYYGGTDNPLEGNSGDPKAYNITAYGDACSTTDANADPYAHPLSGYAFLAENAAQLSSALKTILRTIMEKSYSYTAPTIPSVRVIDKDVVYISSFIPNETPFWRGNIKAYRLNSDGTLPVDKDGFPLSANLLWDAFETLKATAPNSRSVHTYVGNAMKPFIYANLTNADLDVPTDEERGKLINHVRGLDAYDINLNGNSSEERQWKLGDIFHSNAVIVGEPSRYYEDEGFSGPGNFYETNKNRTKVVVVGSNDGMLHAFDAATGEERWAFIPPGVLKTLKLMPTAHTYYVDSSPKVSDVWVHSGPTDTTKGASEWRTVLVCGLRKGGKTYFALDITDTLNPVFLWEFPKSTDAATLSKVGQSWSEPAIGRVKVEQGGSLAERWVAFIGGGFDYTNNLGRAFFVVDLKTGDLLWEFSYQSKAGEKDAMIHSLTAPPAAIDLNGDGYVDRVYVADLGGKMWVFDVSFNEATGKSNSLWSGRRLFVAPSSMAEKHPVYYSPAVAFDEAGVPWVYFGTGDRENPKDTSGPYERFYAVRDDGSGPYPRTENDLADVTGSNTYTKNPSKYGWLIQMQKTGQHMEKVLARPVVFNGLVYFTTYTYKGEDPCDISGFSRLYIVEYRSAGGAVDFSEQQYTAGTPSQRSVEIGSGVPSSPVISVNLKGQASVIVGTTSAQVFSRQAFSPPTLKNLLYWRRVVP